MGVEVSVELGVEAGVEVVCRSECRSEPCYRNNVGGGGGGKVGSEVTLDRWVWLDLR